MIVLKLNLQKFYLNYRTDLNNYAEVVELVDTVDLSSTAHSGVQVRLLSSVMVNFPLILLKLT